MKQASIRRRAGHEHTLGVAGTRRGFGTAERFGLAEQLSGRELLGDAIEIDGDQRVADVEKDRVDVGVRNWRHHFFGKRCRSNQLDREFHRTLRMRGVGEAVIAARNA